jgi:diguanylate cyclase (GGDEF)-like protein
MGNWPLQWKVMLWIAFAQIALTFTVFVFVVQRSDNALKVNSETIFRDLDTVMATALIDPLLQADYALLQRLADELFQSKAVEGIKILSPSGKPYAASGIHSEPRDGAATQSILNLDWDSAKSVGKVRQIRFASQDLGAVHYSISLAPQLKVRNELLRQFASIAVLTTLLAITIGFALSAQLVRRIQSIKKVSDAAISGDYSLRIEVDSEDELGRLAAGFNQLSESVNLRLNQLTESERLKTTYLNASRTEQARLHALLNSMKYGVILFGKDGSVIYQNDAAHKVWSGELPVFEQNSETPGEREIELEDGRIICQRSHIVYGQNIDEAESVGAPNQELGSLWILEDITAERKAQNTIQYLAERDSLTGLYNRRSFTLALQQTITSHPDEPVALVYIDLDNFKLINDIHGHQQGDKVLVDVGKKLASLTRADDIVARIGGDEFVILAKGITPSAQANWCERLVVQLSALGSVKSKESDSNASDSKAGGSVSCSVGIAWFPKDTRNHEKLMAAADEAMYDAKRSGKNAWRSFQRHEEREEEKVQTVIWAERLNHAVRHSNFEIFLQGVHDAKTKEIHHYEALIRMPNRAEGGEHYSPNDFIAHAEASGKIGQLDRWMILQTIKLLARNPEFPPIAVNVSAMSLSDNWLSVYVEKQLLEHAVSGRRLQLELTETAALADIHSAQATVAGLKHLGCEVCLDDFGSGFASLTYLKLIDADYLKIDGIFIQDIHKDRENQVLLRAIVDIAQSSGRKTVAEWIENETLLETVRSFHVDFVQGFHLSKPEPALKVMVGFISTNERLAEIL